MEKYFIQLFDDIDDEMLERISKEFNYYMYDTKYNNEIIYYKLIEKTIIFIINDSDIWSENNVKKFLRIVFRDNHYIHIKINNENYNGWHDSKFWKIINGNIAKEIFDDPKLFRKVYKRQKTLNKIKKIILNKKIDYENISLRKKTD